MANATLSPKELAALLAKLDTLQDTIDGVRAVVIHAMAARRRPSVIRRGLKGAARRRKVS